MKFQDTLEQMTREYATLWERKDACSLPALRTLVPEKAAILAHLDAGDAGFLAARFDAGQRSVVYLQALKTLLVYDSAAQPEAVDGIRVQRLGEGLLALSPADAGQPELLREVDLVGASAGDWVVWFHRYREAAQSAVSFLLPKGRDAKFLTTGLAPGAWDVWHDGWLEESPLRVQPQAGAACWTSARGSYFLRRQAAQ